MAFLLSPKTGGGAVSYLLISGPYSVSVNGAEARAYEKQDGVTVSIGDVLTWAGHGPDSYAYAASKDAAPIKTGAARSPYAVEAVAGGSRAGALRHWPELNQRRHTCQQPATS